MLDTRDLLHTYAGILATTKQHAAKTDDPNADGHHGQLSKLLHSVLFSNTRHITSVAATAKNLKIDVRTLRCQEDIAELIMLDERLRRQNTEQMLSYLDADRYDAIQQVELDAGDESPFPVVRKEHAKHKERLRD